MKKRRAIREWKKMKSSPAARSQNIKPPSTFANPGIAVIGAGYWGRNLIRNFHQLEALKLICDKNEVVLSQFRGLNLHAEMTLSLNELFSREDIQGVVIATPAETHFPVAREALLSGKHVFVEKPLVLVEKEGDELISIAKDKKLVLMVGHLLQYHPVFMHLKELALSGELGRINYIYSHRLNLGKIRREENILWSFAPHDISMILSLAGEEPEGVVATGGNYLHKKIADVTTTHLDFASGLRSHIFVSWLHPFKDQKLVVVGDRKMAVFDDTRPWPEKLILYSHEIKWQNQMPIPAAAKPEHVNSIQEREPLRLECEHFLHCMRTGQTPRTDGLEGLRVLRILNASQLSLDNNGCKVFLKEKADSFSLEPSAFTPHTSRGRVLSTHLTANFFAHSTAVIDQDVTIGAGCKIWHFSHVLSGSNIGEGCNIGQNVVIGPDVVIGKGCKIQNNVSVYKGVTLEDGVFCGPSMVFTNVYNPRAEIRKMSEARPTLVKKGATIGANATIICGITLGEYSFVGAGAVVTKNVPEHALVMGNPAKPVGWACTCGERLTLDLQCLSCGKQFEKIQGGIREKDRVSLHRPAG
jgi:UDP-2-acetamido-3-amino-2,3-dideoxy-glucuronate N-acetyltransferase